MSGEGPNTCYGKSSRTWNGVNQDLAELSHDTGMQRCKLMFLTDIHEDVS